LFSLWYQTKGSSAEAIFPFSSLMSNIILSNGSKGPVGEFDMATSWTPFQWGA